MGSNTPLAIGPTIFTMDTSVLRNIVNPKQFQHHEWFSNELELDDDDSHDYDDDDYDVEFKTFPTTTTTRRRRMMMIC